MLRFIMMRLPPVLSSVESRELLRYGFNVNARDLMVVLRYVVSPRHAGVLPLERHVQCRGDL